MFQTAQVIDPNGLSVPYREIWYRGVISRDRNSIPPKGFDSRYPPTPHHQNIGAIKKKFIADKGHVLSLTFRLLKVDIYSFPIRKRMGTLWDLEL